MSLNYDVIAAGHICLDLSPKFTLKDTHTINDIFVPGRLINMNGIDFSAGGPVANTGFAIGRLGLRVYPMANIGDDELGDILSTMVLKETNSTVNRRSDVSTSYSIVLSIPKIDRIILHDPAGNNMFTSINIDYKKLNQSRLFHFGYPPLMKSVYENNGNELLSIFKKAKKTGITTSLDMSLPDIESESGTVDWQLILEKVLPYVDIFMPSIEEALFMLDKKKYDDIKKISAKDDFTNHIDPITISNLGRRIMDLGCAMTIIKCGSKGIYFKSSNENRLKKIGRAIPTDLQSWSDLELFRETYVVTNFKSALAGGDTTIAGFLCAMLSGYNVFDSLKIACKTGALCCTTYDSISGLLPLSEIFEKTENEQERNNYNELKTHCTYIEETQIWKYN